MWKLLAAASLIAACTRHNPEYCDDTRPCAAGLACDLGGHTCVTPESDTIAPTIIAVDPPTDAVGVAANAAIVVAFSEPMDRDSIASAWASAELPVADVMFSWNESGDVLTVTSIEPLPIATGNGLDPSGVAARHIAYAITTDATDVARNALAAQFTSQFTTIRQMTHDVGVLDALTQTLTNENTNYVISPPDAIVGDSSFADVFSRAFVTFALPTLPAGASLRSAELRGNQYQVGGIPYVALGNVVAFHVNFDAFYSSTIAATPLATVGEFSNGTTLGLKTIDVTAQVRDDYANASARGNRSQYRLQFPIGTNNDGINDYARFKRLEFVLRLIYELE